MSGLFAGDRWKSRFRAGDRLARVRQPAVALLLASLSACRGGEAPPGGDQRDRPDLEVIDSPAAVPGTFQEPGSPPGTPGAAAAPARAPGGERPGVATAPASDGWTAGVVERARPGTHPATLVAVRSGRHEGHERVVFEFAGDAVPGYRVEYIDRPVRQCGSGDAVPVAGDAWLEVRFEPAYAHTDEGRPTVTDRSRRVGFPNLRQLELTCDFEAHVTWVLGLASPMRFRVAVLSAPARVVVDVAD
jgi:hypothetical protein